MDAVLEREVIAISTIVERLKEAGEKVVGGSWTIDAFVSFLDEMQATMKAREASIRQEEIPPEAADDFREELELGFKGIDGVNQGLSEMRLYALDLQASHIEAGLTKARTGQELIMEAMRKNRENRARLEAEELAP